MKKAIFLLGLLISFNSYSQSNFKKFQKLSGPKKWWVIWHPFKAKKALEISKETNKVSDSITKTNLLDKDWNGGQVDAFRHAYWMARLRQEIGKRAARSLGKAHEKENYLYYKKQRLEDEIVPDKISSEMDLFNNDIGLTFTKKRGKTSKKELIYKIINAIKAGKMRVIKKDKKKRYLTCNNIIILKEDLKGRWENSKCLVKSDYKKVR